MELLEPKSCILSGYSFNIYSTTSTLLFEIAPFRTSTKTDDSFSWISLILSMNHINGFNHPFLDNIYNIFSLKVIMSTKLSQSISHVSGFRRSSLFSKNILSDSYTWSYISLHVTRAPVGI